MIKTLSESDVHTVKIENRDTYETEDSQEIGVVRNDPEIEEVKEKKVEVEKTKSKK